MQNESNVSNKTKPARGNGETILLIEDELEVRKVLRLILETYGYRVLIAESGTEGLAIFKSNQAIIRVTVTDMRMNGVQGPEVIRALRDLNDRARIIAMSGFRDGHDRIPEEPGRLIFLPKPMSGRELVAAVQSLLA